MYILEIFRKRKKFEPIFKQAWDRLSSELVYPPAVEDDPSQKLVYFAIIAYAAVYQAALRAGMSSSAGHYLARLQIGKYKLGKPVAAAAEAVFSGSEDTAYADVYHQQMADLIERVQKGEGGLQSVMMEMSQHFRPVPL